MLISKATRILRAAAVPLLFSAATFTLLTVEDSLQRRAERAKPTQAQTAGSADSVLFAKILGLKFRELSLAAERGDLVARVELGRRFALGLGVRKDEARAAAYLHAVIDEFQEIGARDKRGTHVAAAYRQLAELYKTGAPRANISANPSYAFSLLHHAASYFADPAAQFALAKLLLAGEGVTKNTRAAAQWLLTASRKGYAPAQALLGELLWRGEGVKRAPGDGLGLLAIARRNAAAEDRAWVGKMFETARAQASPTEILEANAFIVQEASASQFGEASDILINGENSHSSAPSQIGPVAATPSWHEPGARQGPIFHDVSSVLSGAMENPVAPIPAAETKDLKMPAGLFQMYHPQGMLEQGDGSLAVRYAGVSK